MTRSVFALAVAATVALPCLTAPAMAKEPDATTVQVWGRSWAVTQVEDQPDTFWAMRDNNNNNMFGQPARLRTHQAIRAISAATGCRVISNSMFQTITGRFQAKVSCQ